MRLIVQRVTRAAVSVEGRPVSQTSAGLFVLVGIHRHDSKDDVTALARKLMNLRVFSTPPPPPSATKAAAEAKGNNDDDSNNNNTNNLTLSDNNDDDPFGHTPNSKGWTRCVMDCGLDLMIVSQFTLSHVMKGNKPDFHNAMAGDTAREVFDRFVSECGALYDSFTAPPKSAASANSGKQKQSQQPLPKTTKPRGRIAVGAFGEHMTIQAEFDGPVTITLESQLGEAAVAAAAAKAAAAEQQQTKQQPQAEEGAKDDAK